MTGGPSTIAVAMVFLTVGAIGGIFAEGFYARPAPAAEAQQRPKYGCPRVNAVDERLSHSLMQAPSIRGPWKVECYYGP